MFENLFFFFFLFCMLHLMLWDCWKLDTVWKLNNLNKLWNVESKRFVTFVRVLSPFEHCLVETLQKWFLVGTEIYSHNHAPKCTCDVFCSYFGSLNIKIFCQLSIIKSRGQKSIHLLFSSNGSSASELQVRKIYSLCSPVDVQHLYSCSHSRMTVPQLHNTATPGANGAL